MYRRASAEAVLTQDRYWFDPIDEGATYQEKAEVVAIPVHRQTWGYQRPLLDEIGQHIRSHPATELSSQAGMYQTSAVVAMAVLTFVQQLTGHLS